MSPPPWPNYIALADPSRPLDLVVHQGARRFDPGVLPGFLALWALAALDVLEEAGIAWITSRGPTLAARLASMLSERGIPVTERGSSTLVSFAMDDAPAFVEQAEAEAVIVRDVPARGLIRASIGAWCLDDDLETLVDIAARASAAGKPASPRRATVIQKRSEILPEAVVDPPQDGEAD
jgi:selenocysteine lyase/cysteine desulfurase